MIKKDYDNIESYVCFKLLAKEYGKNITIKNAKIDSTTLQIVQVPIEYSNEVIYLAAGSLGLHRINISAPDYEKNVLELEVTPTAQNLDIYIDSTGEKPYSMKQSM